MTVLDCIIALVILVTFLLVPTVQLSIIVHLATAAAIKHVPILHRVCLRVVASLAIRSTVPRAIQ